MKSNTETGHVTNVASFRELISYCNSLGSKYAPGKAALQAANLVPRADEAFDKLQVNNGKKISYINAVNTRQGLFEILQKRATSVVNILHATDATPRTVEDAHHMLLKIRGTRIGRIKLPDPVAEPAEAGSQQPAEERHISVSQTSCNNLVDHFAKMVELVKNEASYQPTEPELTVKGLEDHLDQLRTSNNAVMDAYTSLGKSIRERNEVMYLSAGSLVTLTSEVKRYIRGVFGFHSPEFKAAARFRVKGPSNLRFKKAA